MTDTSALIEGHHLVTSYPAAWCQCHHRLDWETRAEDHAAHVVATIQAQALREAADVVKKHTGRLESADGADEVVSLIESVIRHRAARLTDTSEGEEK